VVRRIRPFCASDGNTYVLRHETARTGEDWELVS
jgi:hypothetical protein